MRAAWWWIDRWRKSPSYTDMTLAEQGAYRNLLDELWIREGGIPNDERILARACGDAIEWPNVRKRVLAQFYLKDGFWYNHTHDEVMGKAKNFRDSQAEKGKKGAKARWGEDGPANGPAIDPANNSAITDDGPANGLRLRSPSPLPSQSPSRNNGVTDSAPTVAAPAPATGYAILQERKMRGEPPFEPPAVTAALVPVKAKSWTAEACEDWSEFSGGVAPGGKIGAALKPLVAKVAREKGWDEATAWSKIRPYWRKFCESDERRFGPHAFAENPRRVIDGGGKKDGYEQLLEDVERAGGWDKYQGRAYR